MHLRVDLLDELFLAVFITCGIIVSVILLVATRNLREMVNRVSINLKIGQEWFERIHKVLIEIRDKLR